MRKHVIPALIFLCAVLAIALPVLFTPGQVFMLDTVFPPVIDLHALAKMHFGATLPVVAILGLLNLLLPMSIVSKIFMVVVLLLPMVSMYYLLASVTRREYAILGGLMMLFNPFMYERFMAGHWFVMMGLGFLPVVFYFLRRTLTTYSFRHTTLFALVFGLYPIISLHFAYIGMGLVVLYTVFHIASRKREHIFSKKYAKHGALFIAIVLTINAFWMLSFFRPHGTFASIDTTDFVTFVTQGDSTVGVVGNILSLYGFWRESALLPKDVLPLWWIPSLLILALSLFGLKVRMREGDKLAKTLLVASPIAVVLAIGFATPSTEWIVQAVLKWIPGFSGLRETAKLTGVLAFTYAYFAPMGLEALVRYFYAPRMHVRVIAVSVTALLVLATSFTFLWGALGQVQTGTYPTGWKVVDDILVADVYRGKILVFPWRGYLEVNFAGGEFIANPAHGYFHVPVEVSESINNTIYDGKYTTAFDDLIPIDEEPDDIASDVLALRAKGVTHVILMKTSDWERYIGVLEETIYFDRVYDNESIALYRLK